MLYFGVFINKDCELKRVIYNKHYDLKFLDFEEIDRIRFPFCGITIFEDKPSTRKQFVPKHRYSNFLTNGEFCYSLIFDDCNENKQHIIYKNCSLKNRKGSGNILVVKHSQNTLFSISEDEFVKISSCVLGTTKRDFVFKELPKSIKDV